MPSDGIDRNMPSCTGKSGKEKVPKPAKEPRNREKLVRIGSRYFSKDSHTKRKFNIGFGVEKAPGGVAFKTQNELVTDKQRTYNPVNRKTQETSLAPVVEEETD